VPKFCDKPHGSFVSEDSRDVSSRDRRRRKHRTEQCPHYFPGKEGSFRTVVQPVVGPAAVSDEGREISLGFPVSCYGVLYFTYRSDARRIPHASPDIWKPSVGNSRRNPSFRRAPPNPRRTGVRRFSAEQTERSGDRRSAPLSHRPN